MTDDTILNLLLDHCPGDEYAAVGIVGHDLFVVGDLVKRSGQVITATDEYPPGFDAAVSNDVNTVGLGQAVSLGIKTEKPVKGPILGTRPMGVGQLLLCFCKV